MFAFVIFAVFAVATTKTNIISINVTLVEVNLVNPIYTNVSERINTDRTHVTTATPYEGRINITETPGFVIIASPKVYDYYGKFSIQNSTFIGNKIVIEGNYSVNPFYGYGSNISWSFPKADENQIEGSYKIKFEVVGLNQIPLAKICFKKCTELRIN